MTSTAELIALALLAGLTVAAALAAVSLRNLVHCGLALTLTYAGFAGMFIVLDAEFVGFIQLLVYVGAVAVLIMFVVLLTRPQYLIGQGISDRLKSAAPGIAVAVATFATIVAAVRTSPSLNGNPAEVAVAPVATIGHSLVSDYLLPLQLTGVLLTAALIGAAVIARNDSPSDSSHGDKANQS